MAAETSIEWTDKTWNPVRGCQRVSPGCQHCYAERQAYRFSSPGQPYHGLTVLSGGAPRWTGRAVFVPETLVTPLRWRKPQKVFVNSMSDLFHEDVTNEEITAVFSVMAAAPQHTFQLLTKRPQRMQEWFEWLSVEYAKVNGFEFLPPWPLPNVWLGVSCEDQQRAEERIPLLLQCPAAVRFVSAEPLLGPVDLLYSVFNGADSFSAMAGINWVIVGSESGPGARPMKTEWAAALREQCRMAGVPCFIKQILTEEGRRNGDRKGGDPKYWPPGVWPREFPHHHE